MKLSFLRQLSKGNHIEGNYYFALPKEAEIAEIIYYTSTVLKEQKAYYLFRKNHFGYMIIGEMDET